MSDDLLERIRRAQILAAEEAVLSGRNVTMARIIAGENVVIEDLHRKEAIAAAENAGVSNVVPFKK